MSSAKNLQMVVTVALLLMAAACSLFKEEMHVPQTFELHINYPAAASQFCVLKNVDTNSETLQKHASSLDSFASDNPITANLLVKIDTKTTVEL